MKTRTPAFYIAFPIALLLGVGAAQAQLKAPTKTQPREGLGSGLASPAAPASPAPAAAPAAPAEKPRSHEEVVQDIANCILGALPADWKLAQIEVREIGRTERQRDFEAFSATFVPCDPREPALNVYKLNAALEPAKRNWTRATLVLSKEGKFELQYDYAVKEADKDAKPAAAPEAKKAARKSTKVEAKKN
jgi:hypothetical protein